MLQYNIYIYSFRSFATIWIEYTKQVMLYHFERLAKDSSFTGTQIYLLGLISVVSQSDQTLSFHSTFTTLLALEFNLVHFTSKYYL
jgi:hypothetical protein